MQYHWLNKQNNNKLIIFFTGWSFDEKPFEFLECNNYDVLILFDYNSLDVPEIPKYDKYYLISWSMGVFCAYLVKDKLPKFSKKLAINGTLYPVDDELGIPQKPFILTLRHAEKGLQGKFYQNIFQSKDEYEKYAQTPVQRTIENRVSELNNLYERIKNTRLNYDKYYDKVLISSEDKIIPTQNQKNFWNKYLNPQIIESGHFPYYNFKNWNEILCI